MLKTQKMTSGKRMIEKIRKGALNKTWLLLIAMVIIALAGVTGTIAQSATIPAESDDPVGIGGIAAWNIPERVADNNSFWNMGARSMALDTDNRMHVAYGGDHLSHGWFDGASWQTEIVDSSPYVGQYTSMVINSDINGNVHYHISYYDMVNGNLKYAHKIRGGAWTIQIVDDGLSTTMAAAGEPVFIETQIQPQIDVNGISAINSPTEPTSGVVGKYSSLAIDSDLNPHIAYYDSDNRKLKYASYTGLGWTIETVKEIRTDFKEGKYAALYIDSVNRPHMSYLEDDHDNLRYVYKEGDNWRFAYPDTGGNVGGYTSIFVDSKFNVHISYCQGPLTNNFCVKLKYVTAKVGLDLSSKEFENLTWTKTVVDTDYTGTYSSIAKSGGKVAIAYYDWNNYKLKLATLKDGTWSKQDFDDDFELDHGLYCSLAFDNDGYIHIAFQDLGSGYYKELYWDDDEDEYLDRNIDSQRYVGLHTSLALDTTDKAHISYMDDTYDDLRYATNSSGAWVTSVISSTGNVGDSSSIALDSTNKPHVAYYDLEGGDLEYATLSGSNWITTTVDYTKKVNTGLFPDITINPATNLPYISYYDATNTNLMLANFNGTSWITYTVDGSGGAVGKYNSIDMDASGHIYISYFDENYYDDDTKRLKFAYWTGSSWMKSVVDNTEDVGYYSAIDVDNSGKVHIAYYDQANRALKYALGEISGLDWVWTIQTVDDNAAADYDVGKYASIGVNNNGVPFISYYDAFSGNLKLANKPTASAVWVLQVIDEEGDVGKYTSLDIDSTGYPHISYYDSTLGDLKYVQVNSVDPIVAQSFCPIY
ncbi:MAG: hypothetical protein JW908_14625 [Anaerolineales bacterium]|nr:hypothetical protein [Anaerolineales bacterium]